MHIKLWFALFLFGLNVAAQESYPLLYGAIGDKIFIAAQGYKNLLKMECFQESYDALNLFSSEAQQLKREGFVLENEATKEQRSAYITSLRRLLEEKRVLDHVVLTVINELKSNGRWAELSIFSQSSYALIRNAAYVDPAIFSGETERAFSDVLPVDLRQSLGELKEKLLRSREQNSPQMQCLNDITAINYWMAEAQDQNVEREWCKAYDACDQVINFERAAARSCSQEFPLYVQWREFSIPYRTLLKREFKEECYY